MPLILSLWLPEMPMSITRTEHIPQYSLDTTDGVVRAFDL